MLQITSLESPQIMVPVTLFASNGLGNPSADPISMAFLATKADPQSGDWKTGSWVQSQSGQWVAQVQVGPLGAIALSKGVYFHWIKVVDPNETIIRCVGLLEVT